MFNKGNNDGFKGVLPNILMKTRVHGENTLLGEFRPAKGADLPSHRHPHEQTGYLVSGRIELKIEDETSLVEAGGSWAIPGHFEHSARALEDSVAVEFFRL